MMLVKVHEDGKVIALCDADLVGKKFEEEQLQLDVTERFYGGEEMETDHILVLIQNATTVNIVGEESIQFTLQHHIISNDHIITIQNVPHAQLFSL